MQGVLERKESASRATGLYKPQRAGRLSFVFPTQRAKERESKFHYACKILLPPSDTLESFLTVTPW